jgi:hypothetical protein
MTLDFKRKSKKNNKRKISKVITRKKRSKFTRKMRGGVPGKSTISQKVFKSQKIYENKQNPFIPLTETELYVLGGDYLHSPEWQQILEKYPEGDDIGNKIRQDMEIRMGTVRCPKGQIVFNELPDAHNLPDDFPYDYLLKFVIVKKISRNTKLDDFIIIYSQANLTNLDYAEDYMAKYFDEKLNFHNTGKNIIYITPDIINAINLEQQQRDPTFNLLWERSMNGNNYNAIITEYLIRTEQFNPETDVYLLPRSEISHSCLPNNFKRFPLEMSKEEGIRRPNIYGGFEAVIYKRIENGEEKIYIIVNDQSGHYQTKQETLLNLLQTLLEEKGYGKFTILFPPRDKPEYRTYITNDPKNIPQRPFTRAVAQGRHFYNKKSYNETRRQMQEANTDSSIYPAAQLQRTFSMNQEV